MKQRYRAAGVVRVAGVTGIVRIISFIGLTIAMFVGTLDSTIVNIALPKIMDDFGSTLNDVSWVTTIYTLALAVFMIPASKLADRYGRKKIMLVGLVLFGSCSAACMAAQSLPMLIAFRFVQGVGGAIITPIVLPMGIEVFGKEHTSQIASAVGVVTALAAAGGPPMGGAILQYASWRWVFGINVPMVLIALVICACFIAESYDETLAGRIDLVGLVLLTVALGCVTFGLLQGRQRGWTSPLIIGVLVTGAVALAVFIVVELHIASPLLELHLFREKTLSASSLVYFMTGFALVCPILIFNYFLQDVLNETPLQAAMIIMPISLSIMVAMPIGTKLLDKVGARPVTCAGMLIMSASLLLMSFITSDTPKEVMIVFVVINGVGFGFSCVSLVASVQYLPKNKSGIGSGIVNAARQIGTCLGIAILVTVLDANVASAKTVILDNAIATVDSHNLSSHVKTVAKQQLRKALSGGTSGTSDTNTGNTGDMKQKVTDAAKSDKGLPVPSKTSDFYTLYVGNERLVDGGQRLADALGTLEQKMTLIRNGASTAASGSGSLGEGLRAAAQGGTTLAQGDATIADSLRTTANSVASSNAQTLIQAMEQIYASQQQLAQGSATLSSGVGALATGAAALQQGNADASAGVDGAGQALASLASGSADVSSSMRQIIGRLTSTASSGTQGSSSGGSNGSTGSGDSGGSNGASSASRSDATASTRNGASATVVADSNKTVAALQQLINAQDRLVAESELVVTRFGALTSAAGQLKVGSTNLAQGLTAAATGAKTLADGNAKVSQALRQVLAAVTASVKGQGELADALQKISGGASNTSQGSQNLADGLEKLSSGADSLHKGNEDLSDALTAYANAIDDVSDAAGSLSDGQQKISTGIKKMAQAQELKNALADITNDKNAHLGKAFSRTYLLTALIILLCSPVALWTDRWRAHAMKGARGVISGEE